MNADFMKQMGSGGKDSFGEDFLGPDYKYHNYIKKPEEMGMSEAGNFNALANNISGVINYANVLISGKGNARKGSQPLGSKFFINTGGKCKPAKYKGKDKKDNDKFKELKSNKQVERFVYIDNTVKGHILGPSNTGLIPGMLENIEAMNPLDIMSAFSQDAVPYCKKISRSTMPDKGVKTHHVAFSDLDRAGWTEGFETMLTELKNMKNKKNTSEIDINLLAKYPMLNLLTTSVSISLLVLIVYLMKR